MACRRAAEDNAPQQGSRSVGCDFRDNCLPVAAVKGCACLWSVWFLRGTFGTQLAE